MAHAVYAEQCRLLWSILDAKIMKIFRNAVILPMKVFLMRIVTTASLS